MKERQKNVNRNHKNETKIAFYAYNAYRMLQFIIYIEHKLFIVKIFICRIIF